MIREDSAFSYTSYDCINEDGTSLSGIDCTSVLTYKDLLKNKWFFKIVYSPFKETVTLIKILWHLKMLKNLVLLIKLLKKDCNDSNCSFVSILLVISVVLCNICSKWLATRACLWKHTQLVHGENKHQTCSNCGISFRLSFIKRHERICKLSDQEKAAIKVECDQCGKILANKVKLTRHIRFIHNNSIHRSHLSGNPIIVLYY